MISNSVVGFSLVGVGLIMSVFGMVSFTGIIGLSIPTAVMVIGFIITISGLVIMFIDLKENESIIMQHLEEEEKKRKPSRRSR